MNILFALVLLATIHGVSDLRWHRAVVMVLAAIWLALKLLGSAVLSQPLLPAADAVLISSCCHSAAVLLWHEVKCQKVSDSCGG